jgi:hypothetical protein
MSIASNRRDRALLLLQIAEECPQFKEQAASLAYEWFINAAIEGQLRAPGRKRNPGQFEEEWSILIERIALAMR